MLIFCLNLELMSIYLNLAFVWDPESYFLEPRMLYYVLKINCGFIPIFQTGSRYHALQRPSYVQDHVPSFLKPSYSQSHMEDQFCMLEKSTSRKSKWGKGKYCIYQKTDSCPEGIYISKLLFV